MTDRRTQLLEATCRVIARHGVRGLRVEDVGREAGASTALIYYYFGDRAGLITSAMAHVNDRAGSYAHAATGRTGREQVRRQLLGEFQDDDEVRENSAVWGEVRGAAVFDPALRPIIDKATETWIHDLVALVSVGQQDGSISAGVDGQGLAVRMSGLVEGLSNRWLSGLLSTTEVRSHVAAGLDRELDHEAPAPKRRRARTA